MSLGINAVKKSNSIFSFYLILVVISSIILKLIYFPHGIPLTVDSLEYFLYASNIVALNDLPDSWMPINNGWSIFLSFWFYLIPLENVMNFMDLQRLISITISSLTAFPIYFLCKKFVKKEYAIFASTLFVFEPRIILNSIYGLSEPLFIILGISSLVFFLKNDYKSIFISSILGAFCILVRGEGIFFIFALLILFFLKNKINLGSFKRIIPAIGIFAIIVLPVLIHRVKITGSDGVFLRATQTIYDTPEINHISIFESIYLTFEMLIKFFGWVTIPMFIVLIPIGIYVYLKKRNSENNFIIVIIGLMLIPILYAYSIGIEETRYLYFIFPLFCLISAMGLEKIFHKNQYRNIFLIFALILSILVSVIFYDLKQDDWRMNIQKELEYIQISKEINQIVFGVNHNPIIGRYMYSIQLLENWPINIEKFQTEKKIIPWKKYNSIEDFIFENKADLTHLVIDNESDLPDYLANIFTNKPEFLEMTYNSKNNGFQYEFRVFKIDYKRFNEFVG